MIKIIVNMPVKPGKVEEFKALAKDIVAASAAEAGNVYYTLNVSKDDPNLFAIMECWKDQAAINYHNATPHFTGILPKMIALCEGDIPIKLYDEVQF